jgi:hypothetical protein
MAFNVVIASAETDANAVWRYTFSTPTVSWNQPSFDDSGWSSGPGGFGDTDRDYTRARTAWTGSDIWLRRSFSLSSIPSALTVKVYHGEGVDVFINGMVVASVTPWSHGYESFDVPASVISSPVVGSNTIAVHCRNTTDPQFIDVGLVTYTWQ